MPPTRKAPQDRKPKATEPDDVDVFTWTSPRGVEIQLLTAADLEYGALEDALTMGDAAGMAHLVRGACLTEDDHQALRRMRIRDIEALFTAWQQATPGESPRSST